MTEHEHIIKYLNDLNLKNYIGDHLPNEVVILADSGYDNKRIQNVIKEKGWNFIIALKNSRNVKSIAKNTLKSNKSGWERVCNFFKNQRRLGWETIQIIKDSPKKKRMEFRIRHTNALLKSVGEVQVVCSEYKKNPKGKRKYLACTDLKIKPKQILVGYRFRWHIEIFHKQIKMHLGFEDISPVHFKSVESHVNLVYCAYILLHAKPPGVSEDSKNILDMQHCIRVVVENKKIASVLQELTRVDGLQKYKDKLKSALAAS